MRKPLLFAFLLGFTVLAYPVTAFANSSWTWLTQTTPLFVLPFAIVFTLVVEIFSVIFFGRVATRRKATLVVTLANLASFLLPLLINWLIEYPLAPEGQTALSAFINETPFFIIGVIYLIFTLIVEMPVVYFFLNKSTNSKYRLLIAIFISNAITTAAVAAAEHLLCVRALY
jgi:hypothetical protein